MGVIHNTEWRDIAAGAGKTPQHCKLADADKLMDHTVARNESFVFHPDVTGQKSTACYDSAVADLTVMGNVGVIHNEIIIANKRRGLRFGAPVDLRVFSNYVTMAYP
jgi:hypothetical protein